MYVYDIYLYIYMCVCARTMITPHYSSLVFLNQQQDTYELCLTSYIAPTVHICCWFPSCFFVSRAYFQLKEAALLTCHDPTPFLCPVGPFGGCGQRFQRISGAQLGAFQATSDTQCLPEWAGVLECLGWSRWSHWAVTQEFWWLIYRERFKLLNLLITGYYGNLSLKAWQRVLLRWPNIIRQPWLISWRCDLNWFDLVTFWVTSRWPKSSLWYGVLFAKNMDYD